MRKLATSLGVLSLGFLVACADGELDQALKTHLQVHVLQRAGYGPDTWSYDRLDTLGVDPYLDEQLNPASIADPTYAAMEAAYPVLPMSYRQVRDSSIDGWQARQQLTQAKILRAIYSRRQLEAVLIDFWFDHFNVFGGNGLAETGLVPYERQVIAPHVLGRFEDLLRATAESAAMMDYLDNDENSRWGLNENYARELMELHTLGVDGPYTEQDILEVARCFTGWTTDYDASDSETGFIYRDERHDDGEKLVLGQVIPAGGGMDDGLQVLTLLARHPTTAEFVSRKLVERFVSETPPEALVQEIQAEWLRTDGDLRAVMETLLKSPAFLFAPVNQPPKVKRPLVFLASLARALDATGDELPGRFAWDLVGLGEELFMAAPPTGYPESSTYWSGNGTLLARFNIGYETARGWHGLQFALDETGTPEEIADALISRVFVTSVSSPTRLRVLDYVANLPDYVRNDQRRVAEEILGMLVASPEFLQH